MTVDSTPSLTVRSIGELCEVLRGVSYSKEDARNVAATGYVPLLRAMNIERELTFDPLVWVPSKYVAPAQMLRVGDIVIASSSGSRSVVGKGAQLREQWPGSFGAFCAVLRPRNDDPVDARYMAHFVSSPAYRHRVSALAAGVNINNLRLGHLQSLPMPWPDANKRAAIVTMLDAQLARIGAGGASTRAALARVAPARRAILTRAFTGTLVTAGQTSESGPELLSRIREVRAQRASRRNASALQPSFAVTDLPSGWASARWSEVGDAQNGRPFSSREYTSAGIKLLRPGNLHVSGRVEWTHENTRWLPETWVERTPDLLVGAGEIVMNLTAQSLKDEFLGRACMTGPGERCLLNQRLARLTPTLLDRRYVYWVFRSPRFRSFVRTLNKGSLIQHMFTSQLALFEMPIPPLEEQRRIAEELDARFSVLDYVEVTIRRALGRLGPLTDAILSHALGAVPA